MDLSTILGGGGAGGGQEVGEPLRVNPSEAAGPGGKQPDDCD